MLVAGYAVYQGDVIFKELAARMDQFPGQKGADLPPRPAAAP